LPILEPNVFSHHLFHQFGKREQPNVVFSVQFLSPCSVFVAEQFVKLFF
jgi:hypothetical protein